MSIPQFSLIIFNILIVIAWSIFLWYDWKMALLASCVTSSLAILVGLRVWYLRSRHAQT